MEQITEDAVQQNKAFKLERFHGRYTPRADSEKMYPDEKITAGPSTAQLAKTRVASLRMTLLFGVHQSWNRSRTLPFVVTKLWQYSDGQEISRASNVLFAQHGELVMMTNTGLNKVIPAGAKLSGITDHLAPRAVTILCV